jgi:hypothetical protein
MLASAVYTAPGTIGSGTANTGSFTSLAYSTTLTGGTGIVNLGSGQFYKDASGNVGIGTSSPNSKFHVNATSAAVFIGYGANFDNYIQTNSNTIFTNYNASAEYMRINSSGNLLVGTTDSGEMSGSGVKLVPFSGTTANYGLKTVSSQSTNAYVTQTMYSTGASAYRFYVGWGGTISATSTTITGISDVRLKENIRDLDDGLEKVMALKPRKFDWKENKGKNISNDRGFIAQEFEIVFPDMIEEWQDQPPEGEEPYKAVNANLIPTLVKAIQEQQALIQSLTIRITALESK